MGRRIFPSADRTLHQLVGPAQKVIVVPEKVFFHFGKVILQWLLILRTLQSTEYDKNDENKNSKRIFKNDFHRV